MCGRLITFPVREIAVCLECLFMLLISWEQRAHKYEGKVYCGCFWKSWVPASCRLLHVVLAYTNIIPTCSFVKTLFSLMPLMMGEPFLPLERTLAVMQ